MHNVEIELKYKVDDLEKIENEIKKLGAKFEKEFDGRDSYFLVPDNNDGRKYLRVREKEGRYELCFHYVPTNTKSLEWETSVDDGEMTKEILRQIGHKDDVIVEKKRKVYKFKNSEIVLDIVKGLGSFVEIESPSENELYEIERELGFNEKMRIDDLGYPDMIRGYLIGAK
jgi:adenylate cyclase class 2